MKRVVVCLLLSAILLAACSNEKTEESLAPSEDAAVSTAFSEEAGAVSGTSSDAEESSMNENTKKVLDGSKLVVFGDSLTALGSWGETLADELNMYYFNGAMGGITSEEGIGRFGAFVANREPDFVTLCFGMNVYAYTSKSPDQLPQGIKKATMEGLLSVSDIITLHCPLNEKTNRLVCADTIQYMRDGVIIVNTGRGPLVDENDMAEALHTGKVGAYCADVMCSEPPSGDNPLFSEPNAYITPHVAWASVEARTRLMSIAENNIKAFLDGTPQNVVNKI